MGSPNTKRESQIEKKTTTGVSLQRILFIRKCFLDNLWFEDWATETICFCVFVYICVLEDTMGIMSSEHDPTFTQTLDDS